MSSLSGRTAFITGATRGIGLAIGKALAAEGANIVVIGKTTEPHPKLPGTIFTAAAEIEAAGGQALPIACDIRDEAKVQAAVDQAVERFGGIDILVNNAGILRDKLMVKFKDGKLEKRMELAQWQSVIDVNLTGVFLCGREAATRMIENGDQGAIINIASISRAGNMGQSNYSAAKAGVSALVPVWARELARHGIRCAGIAPGFIETEMTASMKPEALEKMTAGIPLKRMGKPEEIASAAAFIFENDYMSGRMLEVDGALRL
ncbi:MAG TPA: short chain dehydrogenase [Deltaproteobacteria bacterium]|nr:short chain dehydrogenase [Deltaproteobacteria bacterium]